MSFVDTDEATEATKANSLLDARLILADLTSYDDHTIYSAAMHVASHGETQSEREKALAFTALLSDLIEDSESTRN